MEVMKKHRCPPPPCPYVVDCGCEHDRSCIVHAELWRLELGHSCATSTEHWQPVRAIMVVACQQAMEGLRLISASPQLCIVCLSTYSNPCKHLSQP